MWSHVSVRGVGCQSDVKTDARRQFVYGPATEKKKPSNGNGYGMNSFSLFPQRANRNVKYYIEDTL